MDDELNVSAEASTADTTPVETSTAPETAAETPSEGEFTDAWDEDMRGIFEKNSRERDATGRFAAKNSDQSPTEGSEEQAQASAIPVPQSWSAEVKAKWATLPSDMQAFIAKREQDAHKHITQQGQQIAALEPLQRAAELGKQTFEKYGVPADEGIAQLLAANEYLERDAPAAIRDLAKAYKVDLRALVGGQPGLAPNSEAMALRNEVARLRAELNETSNGVTAIRRAEHDRYAKTVETQIAEFAKDKSDFDDLEEDILRQIKVLKEDNPSAAYTDILSKAYDQARWANPESRARALAAEEAKRLEAAKKRSSDAKRVAPLNIKGSTANSSSPKAWDDDLKEIARRHYSN